MVRSKDKAWQWCTSGTKATEVICGFCGMSVFGGVTRLKYHIAGILGHDICKCPDPRGEISEEIRQECIAMLVEKDRRRGASRQVEEMIAKRNQEQFQSCSNVPSVGASPASGDTSSHSRTFYAPPPRIRKRDREQIDLMSSQASAQTSRSGSGGGLGSSSSPSLVQHTLHNTSQMKKLVHEAKKKMAAFWYFHMLPLNPFRSTAMLKEMCNAIYKAGSDFKPPTYSEVRTKLLDEVKSDIDGMFRKHSETWQEKGCSLMCDGWEDKRGRTSLNFLVGSASGIMFLKSIDASKHVKNGKYLFGVIRECIEEIGAENVVQVITDNAAAFVAAGRILTTSYPTIYWTPCAAHCLDLLLEDIGKIQWINMVMRRAKIICKFIYSNQHVHHFFLQFSKGSEIIRPCTTRFATNFILLDSLSKRKSALMNMFISEEWRNSDKFHRIRRLHLAKVSKRTVFDETHFWFGVENTIRITEPLVKVLCIIDSERPSMGFIYDAMEKAKSQVETYMLASKQDSDWSHISSLIRNRWNEHLHTDLHAAAHVLNPKFGFGKSLLHDPYLATGITHVFHKMVTDPQKSLQLISELNRYRNRDWPTFMMASSELGVNECTPDDWWLGFGAEVSNLQQLAIRILTQPCSASRCERNWSVFEHIHSKRRNRLTAERLNDLIFVHYNLKLIHKDISRAIGAINDNKHACVDFENVHASEPLYDWVFAIVDDDPHAHEHASTTDGASTSHAHAQEKAEETEFPPKEDRPALSLLDAPPVQTMTSHPQCHSSQPSYVGYEGMDIDDDSSDNDDYNEEEEEEMARGAEITPSHDDSFTEEELLRLEQEAQQFAATREETPQALRETQSYKKKLKATRGRGDASTSVTK